jgi:type VII secretion-associated serine protease mycosin
LVAACVILAAAAPVVSVSPASAAEVCPATSKASQVRYQSIPELPVELKRFPPDRLGLLSTGSGVVVAVLDSGVDDRHPQLKGQVLGGRNFLGPDTGTGNTRDCNGHGTGVASIIAAKKVDGIQFQGLAPGAKILPVRVSDTEKDTEANVEKAPDPNAGRRFAEAIEWAADQNVKVMNVSLAMYTRDPDVEKAISYAVSKDVVIVAAAGNFSPQMVGNHRTYPAAFDGVLGVGALKPDGMWLSTSQNGDWVDLAAPGETVLMAAPNGTGHQYQTGTSFATPYVSATAALVRSRYPDWPATRVIEQIIATADPAPGGPSSNEYGFGIVNPYRALSERPPAKERSVPEFVPAAKDLAAEERTARREAAESEALLIGGLGLLIAVVAAVVGFVVPRGIRRRWRPAGPDDVED